MRAIPFSVLAGKIANRLGWKPKELNAKQFAAIRDAVSQALAEVWETTWWRDLKRIERRQYESDYDSGVEYAVGSVVYDASSDSYFVAIRTSTGNTPTSLDGSVNAAYWAEAKTANAAAEYSATTTYAVGDQVSYQGAVYQCHTASTGNTPTGAGYWGAVADFLPRVAWVQPGKEAIGRVRRLWSHDPRTNRNAARLEFESTDEGIQCFDVSVTRPWVEYRPRHHVLSGEAWDSTVAYTSDGDDTSTVFIPVVSTAGYTSFATVGQARAAIIEADRVDILRDGNGDPGTFWRDPAYADDGFDVTGFTDLAGTAFRRIQRV